MSPEQKKYLGNTTLVKFLWLLKKVEQVAKWDYRSCWMHHYVEQENS